MLTLFVITLFTSSALLFLLQPMFAKMVLPLLGGTPAVWNTCVVFFQAALLAGYAYSHSLTTRLPLGRQMLVHSVLLLSAVIALPIGLSSSATPPTDHNPILWLLGVLLVSVGLPFFVVSTTAPLLQKWFSLTDHRSAGDPYFLYAASNAGSIVALLAYPVLMEPALRLSRQSAAWTTGYGILAMMIAACAVMAARGMRPELARRPSQVPVTGAAEKNVAGAGEIDATLRWSSRLRWVALAAAPSSLMLGVTTYLSTDIAAVPLLWVIPLVLYLVSFIVAFGITSSRVTNAVRRAVPLVVLPLILIIFVQATQPALLIVPVHLAAFFVLALMCHLELAGSRPSTKHLTEFYLWISVGGLLGGLFNTLLAPVLFSSVAEYPAALAVACMLGSHPPRDIGGPRLWRSGLARVALVSVLAVGVAVLVPRLAWSSRSVVALLGIPALVSFSLSRRPLYFGTAVGAIGAAGLLYSGGYGTVVHRDRTFFGVYRVINETDGEFRSLYHGTTLHGRQSRDSARSAEPLTYYHRTGPVGQLLVAVDDSRPNGRVAVVGLGTGSIAAYARPGQQWTFYEIDPAVVQIARDPQYFTYLSSAAVPAHIVLGDARLALKKAPAGAYDVLILDAFSSDAIPVHLLTREALSVYCGVLAEHGVLAFHISNRHLDLQPVLASLAAAEQLTALVRSDASADENSRGKSASVWLAMARSREDLLTLSSDARWVAPRTGAPGSVWTDDFSNIWTVFHSH